MGALAQKVGRAGYDYQAGKRDAIPNAEVEAMIAKHRRKHSVSPRKIATTRSLHHLVFSNLVNKRRHPSKNIANKGERYRHRLHLRPIGLSQRPDELRQSVGLFNVAQM